MIDIAARFGENLARLRRGADLSQEELSVRASLHRTEISQLERGRTIRNWIRRGELPSYKLGAARRIDPADVDAFLAQRREAS